MADICNITLLIVAIMLVILSGIAIVRIFVDECIHHTLSVDLQGLLNFLSFFKPFYSLFSGTIITLTLYVALCTFIRSKKVDAVESLVHIRELLSSTENMDIHSMLETGTESFEEYYSKHKVHVYNYLGILELGNIYLDKNIISEEDFMGQFGYRIENVFNNQFLKKEIENDKTYWQVLLDLHCKVSCIIKNYQNK